MDEVLVKCRQAFLWQATPTNHVSRYVVKVRDGTIGLGRHLTPRPVRRHIELPIATGSAERRRAGLVHRGRRSVLDERHGCVLLSCVMKRGQLLRVRLQSVLKLFDLRFQRCQPSRCDG